MVQQRGNRVNMTVWMRKDLWERVRSYVIDPLRGRAVYGALSGIVERALEEYLDKLEEAFREAKEKGDSND